MVDNEKLEIILSPGLSKMGIKNTEAQKIVSELNFLSNLLIDIYLNNKNV